MKTVGVVIICYGDKFYLKQSIKALSSVSNQTVLPDEVVLVYEKNGKLHELINNATAACKTFPRFVASSIFSSTTNLPPPSSGMRIIIDRAALS